MSTTSDRFDPRPDVAFARCRNCGVELADDSEVTAHHLSAEGKGHIVQIKNATREYRIKSHVQAGIDDLMFEMYERVDSLIRDGHITQEEADKALNSVAFDVADGWQEYTEEMG